MRYEIYEIIEVPIGQPYDGVQKTGYALRFEALRESKDDAIEEVKELKKDNRSSTYTILEVY